MGYIEALIESDASFIANHLVNLAVLTRDDTDYVNVGEYKLVYATAQAIQIQLATGHQFWVAKSLARTAGARYDLYIPTWLADQEGLDI
jgi:hypothetical protein